MHSCYNCESENSENSIFCKNCGNILKCQNCNTIISENSKFCVNCGTDLLNSNYKSTRAVNKLEFSQKGNSKQFNAEFTDEVGVYFATAFNSLVSGTPLPAKNPFQKNFQLTGGKVNLNGDDNKTTEFPEAEFVELDESIILLKIFKQTDEGKLEIIDNRVKEKSTYDKVKRLTILFLYAKKLSGIDLVGRNELNAFISQEKLRLSDLRQYISKDGKSHISVKDNGNLSILTGGEDYARDILKQVNDQNYSPTKSKGGRKPGKKTTTNTKKGLILAKLIHPKTLVLLLLICAKV
jgi:RNA polymerase subunit RPABC4/transcription elongation factor Spt4